MRRRPEAHERLLATVMFTDIVGSAELATRLGGAAWRQLLSRHNSLIRKELKRYGGREVDTAGDGFFARFEQPTKAKACARVLTEAFDRQGLQIRVGIQHGGGRDRGQGGRLAVHIGSRLMSSAGPNEIVVSSTVRDLVSGSDLHFEDKGLFVVTSRPVSEASWVAPRSREDPELLERRCDMPGRLHAGGQRRNVTRLELQDRTTGDIDPRLALKDVDHFTLIRCPGSRTVAGREPGEAGPNSVRLHQLVHLAAGNIWVRHPIIDRDVGNEYSGVALHDRSLPLRLTGHIGQNSSKSG